MDIVISPYDTYDIYIDDLNTEAFDIVLNNTFSYSIFKDELPPLIMRLKSVYNNMMLLQSCIIIPPHTFRAITHLDDVALHKELNCKSIDIKIDSEISSKYLLMDYDPYLLNDEIDDSLINELDNSSRIINLRTHLNIDSKLALTSLVALSLLGYLSSIDDYLLSEIDEYLLSDIDSGQLQKGEKQ